MIEEYARHNGHADLLRERIDGAVGVKRTWTRWLAPEPRVKEPPETML